MWIFVIVFENLCLKCYLLLWYVVVAFFVVVAVIVVDDNKQHSYYIGLVVVVVVVEATHEHVFKFSMKFTAINQLNKK